MEESESEIMDPKSHFPTYLTFALIAAIFVGGYFLMTRNTPTTNINVPAPSAASTAEMEDVSGSVAPAAVLASGEPVPSGSPLETAGQDNEVIMVEGGSFYYKPNTITVKKGEPVTVTMKSVDMMHDFVIDELDVKSAIAKNGETVTVTFTPTETGEFEFYCSVVSHRAQGMKGTLIVTE